MVSGFRIVITVVLSSFGTVSLILCFCWSLYLFHFDICVALNPWFVVTYIHNFKRPLNL